MPYYGPMRYHDKPPTRRVRRLSQSAFLMADSEERTAARAIMAMAREKREVKLDDLPGSPELQEYMVGSREDISRDGAHDRVKLVAPTKRKRFRKKRGATSWKRGARTRRRTVYVVVKRSPRRRRYSYYR